MIELRGFSDIEKVSESKKEEAKLNNYLLAKDYLFAMSNEMFDVINDLNISKIDKVCYWLNYDGSIGRDKESVIETIHDGSLLTRNNRTLRDACFDNGLLELAWQFDERNGIKRKVKKL